MGKFCNRRCPSLPDWGNKSRDPTDRDQFSDPSFAGGVEKSKGNTIFFYPPRTRLKSNPSKINCLRDASEVDKPVFGCNCHLSIPLRTIYGLKIEENEKTNVFKECLVVGWLVSRPTQV